MDRMSSNNTSVSTPATNTQGFTWKKFAIVFFGLGAAQMLVLPFIFTSRALGSENTWNKIQSEVLTKVWPLTLVGTLCLFITSVIYVLQDPQKTMYLLLVFSCLAIGIAYSSLVISAISR